MTTTPEEIWREYVTRLRYPHGGDTETVEVWYWRDAHCIEPMGPFDSYAEARADHAECRVARGQEAGEP